MVNREGWSIGRRKDGQSEGAGAHAETYPDVTIVDNIYVPYSMHKEDHCGIIIECRFVHPADAMAHRRL